MKFNRGTEVFDCATTAHSDMWSKKCEGDTWELSKSTGQGSLIDFPLNTRFEPTGISQIKVVLGTVK